MFNPPSTLPLMSDTPAPLPPPPPAVAPAPAPVATPVSVPPPAARINPAIQPKSTATVEEPTKEPETAVELNKDGHPAGEDLDPDEVLKFINRQRVAAARKATK